MESWCPWSPGWFSHWWWAVFLCCVSLMSLGLSTSTVLTTCWTCVLTTCCVFSFVRVTGISTVFSAREIAGFAMICPIELCWTLFWEKKLEISTSSSTACGTGVSTICSTVRCWILSWISVVSTIFSTASNCRISIVSSATCDCGTCSHNRAITHLVNTLQLWSLHGLLNSLGNVILSLRHDRGQCQIVLGDLGGFRTSDTCIFAGFAPCLACCKLGKVSVVVAFHLVVKRLRLIGARRWDELLVHESKDAFTDLVKLIFHFRDVLSRVWGQLFLTLWFLLLFNAGDDAPRRTSTVNGILVSNGQQITILLLGGLRRLFIAVGFLIRLRRRFRLQPDQVRDQILYLHEGIITSVGTRLRDWRNARSQMSERSKMLLLGELSDRCHHIESFEICRCLRTNRRGTATELRYHVR